MKKLKFADLIQASNAVHALSEQDKSKSYVFTMTVRFRLADNQAQLKRQIERIQAEKNKLITQYGEKDEKGQYTVRRASEKWAEFEAAIKPTDEEEIEVELKTISLEELANSRVVKTRDDKGKVSEDTVENQISLDVITALISTGILATSD